MGIFQKGSTALAQVGTFLGHIVLLLIRLYWGGSLVLIGLGKFANLPQTATFFETLHIPFPMASATLVAAVELIGGAALFLGLFSRFWSFLLIILFCVAFGTAHNEAVVNIFSNPKGFLMQDPFLYLYASLMVFCFGTGFASFDYWIERSRLR